MIFDCNLKAHVFNIKLVTKNASDLLSDEFSKRLTVSEMSMKEKLNFTLLTYFRLIANDDGKSGGCETTDSFHL